MHGGMLARGRNRTAGILLGAGLGLAALAGASSADAAVVKVSGSEVIVDAASGEDNEIRTHKDFIVSPVTGATVLGVVVQESNAVSTTPGYRCAARALRRIECDTEGTPTRVRMYLDDLADRSGQLTGGLPIAMRVDGGAGSDVLDGGDLADELLGSSGNDTMDGRGGVDDIEGQTDDDTVVDTGATGDVIHGGTGDDNLNGGPGSDQINGYYGNDIIKGAAGADTLDGSYNDDQLFGNLQFDDTADGSVDSFSGGGGNDRLFTDDGLRETEIDCGASIFADDDRAYVDQLDKYYVTNCETVFVFQRS